MKLAKDVNNIILKKDDIIRFTLSKILCDRHNTNSQQDAIITHISNSYEQIYIECINIKLEMWIYSNTTMKIDIVEFNLDKLKL